MAFAGPGKAIAVANQHAIVGADGFPVDLINPAKRRAGLGWGFLSFGVGGREEEVWPGLTDGVRPAPTSPIEAGQRERGFRPAAAPHKMAAPAGQR